MKAVVYCCLDVVVEKQHTMQEVFVMPADGLQIRHIASPCASCNSPIAKSICYAIANHTRKFQLNNWAYTIMNYKVFDHDYIHQYKEPPMVDFTSEVDHIVTIHVFEWKTACSLQNHKVNDIHVVVLNLKNQQPVMFNAFYCPKCERYWLHKSALEEYQKQGKYFQVRFRYYNPWGQNDYGLQRESTLKQYGYNVQAGRMSEVQRHELLKALIYNGLLSRRQILEHLNFCITVPGSRDGMEESCDKWINDIRFINHLPIDTNEGVFGYI